MKSAIFGIALGTLLLLASGSVAAKTSCEKLVEKIEAKLASKSITRFTLLIVPKDEPTTLRVVGTCAGGAKKITYKRG